MILNHAPSFDGNEMRYLTECIETSWVSTAGPFVTRLEERVGEVVGRRAVATASGTAALHIAMRLIGAGPGDEVIVPSLTFVAPANAVTYEGARPVFIDIDDNGSLDPDLLEGFLSSLRRSRGRITKGPSWINPATGRRVAGAIVVDLQGRPAAWRRITPLLRSKGIPVVEDACQALGARLGKRPCGSLAPIAVTSFNGNKIVTSGGGGAIFGSAATSRRARHLSCVARRPGPGYRHDDIGFNYRMTNIEAAVGLAQIEMLDEKIAAKRRITMEYNEALRDLPGIRLPVEEKGVFSTFWLYTIFLPRRRGLRASRLSERLLERGIQALPIWSPVNRLKPFRRDHAVGGRRAEDWSRRGMTLPSGPGLTKDEESRVIDEVRRAWKRLV